MITYEIHPLHLVLDLIKSYSKEHHADIKNKSLYPSVETDWEHFKQLGESGLAYAVFAMDGKKLAGYNCYMLTVDLHKSNGMVAYAVGIFIKKEYRGRLVVEFIKECDKLIFEKDVREVLHTSNDMRIGKLLEKSGYKEKSTTWSVKK